MADLATLIERLASSAPGVRRIAAFDLIRLSPHSPDAAAALLRHLPAESDEKAALAIIRHLAAAGLQQARPALWALYASARTPVVIAHAALLAHDHLAGLERTGGDFR
jgi:hypothetical protein